MPFIPEDVCWALALAKRARREEWEPARDAKRMIVAQLDRNANARRLFLEGWEAQAAYFARCARELHLFVEDPCMIDAVVIELRSFERFATVSHWTHFHRIARDIERIADATRTFRQRCHLAQFRAPAQAYRTLAPWYWGEGVHMLYVHAASTSFFPFLSGARR